MAIDPVDVLDLLDERANTLQLYAFDNGYIFPIDSRLHVYSDGNKWALIVEVLAYNPRAKPDLTDSLECHGNGCAHGLVLNDRVHVRPLDDAPETFPPLVSVRLRDRDIPTDDLDGLPMQDAYRKIATRSDGLLFATEDELREAVSGPLPKLLSLEEWHHPDVVGGEPPSSTSTFRQLAEVVASTDPAAYKPDEPPNTHWSNWPEAGTL